MMDDAEVALYGEAAFYEAEPETTWEESLDPVIYPDEFYETLPHAVDLDEVRANEHETLSMDEIDDARSFDDRIEPRFDPPFEDYFAQWNDPGDGHRRVAA